MTYTFSADAVQQIADTVRKVRGDRVNESARYPIAPSSPVDFRVAKIVTSTGGDTYGVEMGEMKFTEAVGNGNRIWQAYIPTQIEYAHDIKGASYAVGDFVRIARHHLRWFIVESPSSSLPRAIQYHGLFGQISAYAQDTIVGFTERQYPQVAIGEVNYDPVSTVFFNYGSKKWFWHVHSMPRITSGGLATGQWVAAELWCEWNTNQSGGPPNPLNWIQPGYRARWIFKTNDPIGIDLDSKTWHMIMPTPQFYYTAMRVRCRALSNMANQVGVRFGGYISMTEHANHVADTPDGIDDG